MDKKLRERKYMEAAKMRSQSRLFIARYWRKSRPWHDYRMENVA